MPYAKLKESNIYYEIHGQGEPIILINGLKTDHTRWFKLRDLLLNRFQVILFDNRATGRTQDNGRDFDVKVMADDTIQLMNYLNLNSAYIVGHSLGGAIAQTLAYFYPEKIKKLLLLNTFIKLNETAKAGFYKLLQLHEQGAIPESIAEAMIPWGFSENFITPEIKKTILESSRTNPFPQSAHDYKRQYMALIHFNSKKWVNKINVPTFIVASEKDLTAPLIQSKTLTNKIRGAQLFIIPGGHASAAEQPNKIAEIVHQF